MTEDVPKPARSVCVYCASSRRCDPEYHSVAYRLGSVLAHEGIRVVYGGGSVGSMGALADGALAGRGRILGILPRFMEELEWGHSSISELRIVEDMRSRKHEMLAESEAVVALPGGSGTLEELLEAITLKRLGIWSHPIILVNTKSFFDPLLALLDAAIAKRFMDERHRQMWQVVDEPEAVPGAILAAPPWPRDARTFAAL